MAVRMKISRSAIGDAIKHAQALPLEEVCGLFVRRNVVVETQLREATTYLPCKNDAKNRRIGFQISTNSLRSALVCDMEIVALFHSHPGGHTIPSKTDVYAFPSHYTSHGLIYAIGPDKMVHYNGMDDSFILEDATQGVLL